MRKTIIVPRRQTALADEQWAIEARIKKNPEYAHLSKGMQNLMGTAIKADRLALYEKDTLGVDYRTGLKDEQLIEEYHKLLSSHKIEWRSEYVDGVGDYSRRNYAAGGRGKLALSGEVRSVLHFVSDLSQEDHRIEKEKKDIYNDSDRCKFLLKNHSAKLSDWERKFLQSIGEPLDKRRNLSPKQQEFASKIFKKYKV
jgi:hypothetical protein